MKNNSIRKLTIVTVTFNRCYYIERLLTYYASNGFDQSIVIVDASDEKEAAINELLYSKMKKQLSLTVLWANGKTIIECLDRSLGVIATPYATINSDDDFLVPSTLDIMVNFLDNNDEYVGVNGSAVLLGEKVENGIKRIKSTGKYHMRRMHGKTEVDRIYDLFSDYFGILFSIVRVDVFKITYSNIPKGGIIQNELIPACRMASCGEIYHIKDLFLVRGIHGSRTYIPRQNIAILKDDWSDNIELLRKEVEKLTKGSCSVDCFNEIFSFYYSCKCKHGKSLIYKIYNYLLSLTSRYRIKGIKNPLFLPHPELRKIINHVEGGEFETIG